MPAPTDAIDTLSAVTPLGAGAFQAHVPEGWRQGKGLFGGLVAAMLVRAAEAVAPGRPLRSLTAELPAPTDAGEARLEVEVLRAGSAVSTVAVRLVQSGEVRAHGVAVLGAARAGVASRVHVAHGERPSFQELEVIPVAPPVGPEFAVHFEYRTDRFPFAGAPVPEVRGWVRPRFPGTSRDPAYLAACIDAFWPADYVTFDGPRPMATIAYTFQPVGSFDGLDPDAPLFYRAHVPVSTEGYSVENRELWGHDGRLLALNQQTFCIIR